jgi:hypothetical protein
MPDPYGTNKVVFADDPEIDIRLTVLEELFIQFSKEDFKAADAAVIANRTMDLSAPDEKPKVYGLVRPELHHAFQPVSEKNRQIDVLRLSLAGKC